MLPGSAPNWVAVNAVNNPPGKIKNMTTLHLKKSISRSPSRLALLLIPLVFACFALSPRAQAVSPPPDGGYLSGNTAEGDDALFSLTTGAWNTALGFQTLNHNTTGNSNTATGVFALFSNTTGEFNTATSVTALYSNTTGDSNTAAGFWALYSNIDGEVNTAIGTGALRNNTTGDSNTAVGDAALYSNTDGRFNTALGDTTLFSNTTGNFNTALGDGALSRNITGADNIALGSDAGESVTTANNVICIGNAGKNVSDSCFIGNIFGQTSGGVAVLINSSGRLGTMASSAAFKRGDQTHRQSERGALLLLSRLRSATKKKLTPRAHPQFGLVAEEVEKVNPDLVVRDKDGKPYSVRYEQVNAMLLNEFLKEHRKNEEQEATISQLRTELQGTATHQQKQIEALTAGLQKVSAQLEASKPAPQVVTTISKAA